MFSYEMIVLIKDLYVSVCHPDNRGDNIFAVTIHLYSFFLLNSVIWQKAASGFCLRPMCTPHGGHLKGVSHPKICQNAKESESFATRGNDSEAKIFVDRPGMEMGCK